MQRFPIQKRVMAVLGLLITYVFPSYLLAVPVDSVLLGETWSQENVFEDIYHFLSESEEVDWEELQTELTEFAQHPIDLNTATAEDLRHLPMLSDKQIDDILLAVYKQPMQSVYELQLIPSLHTYEVRNLLPFVCVNPIENAEPHVYPREVFRYAKQDALVRLDMRNIEENSSDPIYTSVSYKWHFRQRYAAGLTLRRPVGGRASELQYGAYVELHDLWRFRTIVAGNYQAQFGEGLVLSSTFHLGKMAYVSRSMTSGEGLRKYSGTMGASLHGVGTTIRAHEWVDVSAFYSMTAANDSVYEHLLGTNVTVKHKQWRVGMTLVEKLYTDSLHYYYEHAAYNQNYFRGDRQMIIGANARWHRGMVDIFGEVAAAQNQRWGYAAIAGMRLTPINDLTLSLLYRYYSPTYDNTRGYAFSETSRINDENGVYLGLDYKYQNLLRLVAYGDVFRFSAPKYGVPYAPSCGYDALCEVQFLPNRHWEMRWRMRSREKAHSLLASADYRLRWQSGNWQTDTHLCANLQRDSVHAMTYGASVSQDVRYTFSCVPMTLQLRLQAFDVRDWDNRIYLYENDVLYAFSIPATYGVGGRLYLNWRYQIGEHLTLYLKMSETIYTRDWAVSHHKAANRTDIHLLARVRW